MFLPAPILILRFTLSFIFLTDVTAKVCTEGFKHVTEKACTTTHETKCVDVEKTVYETTFKDECTDVAKQVILDIPSKHFIQILKRYDFLRGSP